MAEQKQKQRGAKSKAPIARKSEKDLQRKKNAKPAYMQAKMAVSKPGDPQEQEADRVAEEVSRKPRSISRQANSGIQRASVNSEDVEQQEQSIQASRQSSMQRAEEEGLAAKIQRAEEEGPATKLMREEETAATKLMREEEDVQAKVQRQEDESLASKIMPMEEEEAQTLAREESEESAPEINQPGLTDESEQRLAQLRGMGDAMQEDVRRDMESQFGTDFSEVKIHTGDDADKLCKEINARAFAVGNDVFFAAGEYAPETEAGRKLLAHELTHVVQQSGGINTKLYRSTTTPPPASPPAAPAAATSNTGNCSVKGHSDITYTIENSDITFNKIRLPPFKVPMTTNGSIVRPAGHQRVDSTLNEHHNNIWRQSVGQRAVSASAQVVNQILDRQYAGQPRPDIFAFRARDGYRRGSDSNPQYRNFIGTAEDISRELSFPTWDKDGEWKSFDVDHMFELQLGGLNQASNFWLLNSTTNMRSGQSIYNFLRNTMAASVSQNEQGKAQDQRIASSGSSDQILRAYNIFIERSEALQDYNPSDAQLPDRYYWTQEEIIAGQHLTVSNIDNILEIESFDNIQEGKVKVFPNQGGGRGKLFRTTGENVLSSEAHWFGWGSRQRRGWRITGKEFFSPEQDPTNLGRFSLTLPQSNGMEGIETESINIVRYQGLDQVGYVEVDREFTRLFGQVLVRGLSPVRIDSVAFAGDGQVNVLGKVIPTVPLMEGLELDFAVDSEGAKVYKAFSLGDFDVPSPFNIDNITLEVGVGSEDGIYANGRVDFGIENLGRGFLESGISSGGGFGLDGSFDFDSETFDPARLEFGYHDNDWSISGTVGIPEGKVPGLKSATITAGYTDGVFSAQGDAELDIPGVDSGTVAITYSEEEGLVIGGTFNLSADVPGIRGGSLSATLVKRPGSDAYGISARGEAQPDIPGINSNLIVAYDDGAFTAEIEADYSRGMLSGRVNAGVSNRTVGEDGQLSETAEPGNPLIVYGGGSLTLQLAPWLQGTAGVQFAPNGEITVTGEIGLPDQLEVFPRYEVNRRLLDVSAQYPIVPAVVAEIGGNLSAQAGIGPGTLNELRLGITYNPDREEDTTITGDASLRVPADAGLRLGIRVGLGLGVPGASVTGGLEISGALGLEAAAEADVHVEWSPSAGLDLRASLRAHVEPAFTFGIGGYVSAKVLGFSVYDDTFEFASYSFGSGYRFGLELPVHYQEGQPFDVSYDDIIWTIPDVDADQLLTNLVARIT